MNSATAPISVTQKFEVSIDVLWNAITQLDQMKVWYFPHLETFEPEVNFKTHFLLHNEGRAFTHQWEVTEVVPHKIIAYLWTFKEYPGKGISTFELTPHSNGSQLTLTSETLEPFPNDIPEFERESGIQGWNYLIKESLVTYLQKQ